MMNHTVFSLGNFLLESGLLVCEAKLAYQTNVR